MKNGIESGSGGTPLFKNPPEIQPKRRDAASTLRRYRRPIILVFLAAIFATGTLRNRDFWLTADQRGDRLMRHFDYALAAKTYTTPNRIGAAQYRDGDFKTAAKTYARVAGAAGVYNQGNALFMHGDYDGAIAAYTHALALRPGWRKALDNRALATARKAVLDAAGENRADEQTHDNSEPPTPDAIANDLDKNDAKKADTITLNEQNLSEDRLRALWLRRVQTTPADFLRFKFAYQAASASAEQPQNSNNQ